MKKYFDFYYISLLIFFIAGLTFFLGHYSTVLIDVGREVYYPEQILKGQVLYKDIFNIYGALAYQINALLYLIFGAKLSTLYFSGCVCSVLAVSGIYWISREFLPKVSSFVVALFTLSVGVCTTSIFNYHFPYSWAVLYGLVSFLYSLFFLIKFEKTEKGKFLIISAFLGGMCTAFKYDFFLYSLVILYFVIKNKSIKAFLSFLIMPFLSYAVLFLQGLRFEDIINTLNIYSTMAKSQTLKYFYQNSGIYFHKKSLPTDILLFVKFLIPLVCMVFTLFKFKENSKLKYPALIFTALITFYWFKDVKFYALGFLPVLLLLLLIFRFKRLNSAQKILAVSTLSVSVKVFWVLLINSYGTYYAPMLILAVLALLLNLRTRFKIVRSAVCVITFFALFLTLSNLKNLQNNYYEIETKRGSIYTNFKLAESTDLLIKYFKTAPKGDVVIFPEGLAVNFLAERNSDNYYNSLLPLYVETFDETEIVSHFKETKPEYIVLSNLDMKDYYFRYICRDYALDFCGFVKENYKPELQIGKEFGYIVYRLKSR